MAENGAERNLIFGILALQMDFVSRDQLIEGMNAWLLDKQQSLGKLLENRGLLTGQLRALLESLVAEHVRRHAGDVDHSLAALCIAAPLREELQNLQDPQVDHSLALLAAADDEFRTVAVPPTPPNAGLRYRVLRDHAEGGLGRVSVARDHELNREVAFKEIKPKYADQQACRDRFLLEAEITGALEHPGIVPVYGLGIQDNGRPYYAMRFIRGETLRDAIRHFHDQPPPYDATTRSLGFRRLLRSFIDACNALEYAHNRGVLHRDLKPANIMLGRYGETLVVDWGLAKSGAHAAAIDQLDETPIRPASASSTAATAIGSAVGTPAYMSPEQSLGRSDLMGRTSDVFSMGATLYGILTGKPPHEAKTADEARLKVERGELVPPRVVRPWVAPALEAICLKAMHRQAKDRYPSCKAMAADIEAWLADEPVSAYREGWVDRSWRWVKRHRTMAVGSAAATLAIALSGAIATVLIDAERAATVVQRDRANELAVAEAAAKREAVAQRQLAVARYRDARQAVDTWLSGASDLLEFYPGVQATREQLLATAAARYEGFAKQVASDPELELERGRAYLRLGEIRRQLGMLEAATGANEQALQVFTSLERRDPNRWEFTLERQRTGLKQAGVLAAQHELTSAQSQLAAVVQRLEALQAKHPRQNAIRETLAAARLNRASLLAEQNEASAAKDLLRLAADDYRLLAVAEPSQSLHDRNAASVGLLQGELSLASGDRNEAAQFFAAAIQRLDRAVAAEPAHPRNIAARAAGFVQQAALQRSMGRYAEELLSYEAALHDYEQLTTAIPDAAIHRQAAALTKIDIAQALQRQFHSNNAEAPAAEARAALAKLVQQFPEATDYKLELAVASVVVASIDSDMGRRVPADVQFAEGLAIFQALISSNPDDVELRERIAVARCQLADLQLKVGQASSAVTMLTDAGGELQKLASAAPELDRYMFEQALANQLLGDALLDSGDPAAATFAHRNAAQLWHKAASSGDAWHCDQASWFFATCRSTDIRDGAVAAPFAEKACAAAPANRGFVATRAIALTMAGEPQAALDLLLAISQATAAEQCCEPAAAALAHAALGNHDAAKAQLERARNTIANQAPDNARLTALLKLIEEKLAAAP